MSRHADTTRPDRAPAPRAMAKSSLYRLAALAFGHPVPEFHETLRDGSFHEAFAEAWGRVTGKGWPRWPAAADFAEHEAGFIAAFQHGPKGSAPIPIVAGEYESLLAGQTRASFMLNVAAFYRHFGVKAATADEGRADEPDHLVSLLEFMSYLAHLEGRALAAQRDAGAYRRAQRDFLVRFLMPLLDAMQGRAAKHGSSELDPTLRQLIDDLPAWCRSEAHALEAQVGAYRDPESPSARADATAAGDGARTIDQNLWG